MGHLTALLIEDLECRRVAQNMSKQRLSIALGISRHTVARKLEGVTELTVGEAYAMCRALGTGLQEVLDKLERDSDTPLT